MSSLLQAACRDGVNPTLSVQAFCCNKYKKPSPRVNCEIDESTEGYRELFPTSFFQNSNFPRRTPHTCNDHHLPPQRSSMLSYRHRGPRRRRRPSILQQISHAAHLQRPPHLIRLFHATLSSPRASPAPAPAAFNPSTNYN
jgi:hypothetical protein